MAPKRASVSEKPFVRIITEGAIAGIGIAEGKLIPVLIVDTSLRPDVDELVRVHEHLPPGDVGSQWGAPKGIKDSVALIMTFTRPSEVTIVLNFDLRLHGGAVDLILASRALYLQPGKEGDRASTTVGNRKILCEVPETGFSERWMQIRHEFLVKKFRGQGLTKRDAKLAATGVIEEFRKIMDFRWPNPGQRTRREGDPDAS